ncbi:MAG: SusC/RagA family TonB-linked outer membrane protein [Gemmatimonadota bacterium]
MNQENTVRLPSAWSRTTGVVALTMLLGASALGAQTGTVSGRATDATTKEPIRLVQVTVSGTSLGALTDGDGRFRITNVPTSSREIRAKRIGFNPAIATLSFDASGAATVSFPMTASVATLDATVVTGAVGDTRKRAIGNSVATVNASDVVSRSAVANITEILQAKTPGLTLMPGSGTVGTAANYRLRGAGSLYAGNSPTIYVDGVRVSQRSQGSYDTFGQTTSSLDAINPADIESIEVIKGPAAATLYGAEAAAGVIQIITKRGKSGTIKWAMRAEGGSSDWDKNLRPINYAVATAARLADTVTWPGFKGKALGDTVSFRAMTDGRALRTAALTKYSLDASGGNERYNFYVSGSQDKEEGVYYNNQSDLSSLRGNFSFVPTSTLAFTTNVALSHNHIRLPLNDNAALGLIISSYLAIPGRSYAFPAGQNYSTITPEVSNIYDNQTYADRFFFGGGAEYRPFAWLTNKFRVGLDANVGSAQLYYAPDPRAPYAARFSLELDNSKGFIAEGRPLNNEITLNYDATAARAVTKEIASNTSFGMQYLANSYKRTDAIGTDLGSAGVKSVSSAAVTTSTQTYSEQKSFGVYGQEQIAWRDRLFATAAMRIDNNSAFGSELNRVFYPKLSLSYVISEEPFFKLPAVNELRLRAAWGQAGNAPGPLDAVRSYTSSVVTTATGTSSALRYGAVGNPDLKPERGSEVELGFEAGFLDGMVNLDATYYDKTTRDALIPVAISPSTGFSGNQLTNLGTISNSGVELLLTVLPIQRKNLSVETTLSLATNANKLVSFGDDRAPIIFGSYAPSQRYQVGYPLGAMWAQQVQRNADGSLLKVAGRPVIDTASVYMGPSVPTREVSFSSGIRLFERVNFHGLLDYKSGHYQFNVKDWRRDRALVSWETANPAADPDEVLVRSFASQTLLHIQKADFLKLRDLSLSYDVPARLLRGKAERLTITGSGHNLKVWTKYGGADPEVNFNGVSTFNRNDSWTVPQTRRYSLSLSVNF